MYPTPGQHVWYVSTEEGNPIHIALVTKASGSSDTIQQIYVFDPSGSGYINNVNKDDVNHDAGTWHTL